MLPLVHEVLLVAVGDQRRVARGVDVLIDAAQAVDGEREVEAPEPTNADIADIRARAVEAIAEPALLLDAMIAEAAVVTVLEGNFDPIFVPLLFGNFPCVGLRHLDNALHQQLGVTGFIGHLVYGGRCRPPPSVSVSSCAVALWPSWRAASSCPPPAQGRSGSACGRRSASVGRAAPCAVAR